LRRELVTEVEGLYAKADGHFVSLHYCDPYSALPPGSEADHGK
jgi:hypothetical protein